MIACLIASLYGQLFSSALVTETADGALMIQSAPGRHLAWVAAFLVAMPLAGWCWRRRIGGHYAPGVFFASFVVPLLVVPGIALESVRVEPALLSIHTGLWFAPTDYRISLAGLDTIIETEEAVDQREVLRRDTFWEFRYRARAARKISLPELLAANRGQVTEWLRRHGVRVEIR